MNRELKHLKIALTELVAEIQRLRRQHVEIDQLASQQYKKAKNAGVQVKQAKAVINSLHGETAGDAQIWEQYKSLVGLDQSATAADSPLDALLDREFSRVE